MRRYIFATILFLCSWHVQGRIREEELITVSSEHAVFTWLTKREKESTVLVSICQNNLTQFLNELSSKWVEDLVQSLDDGSENYQSLMSLSRKDLNSKETEDFLVQNVEWLQSTFSKKLVDEPNIFKNKKYPKYLLNDYINHEDIFNVTDPTPTKYHYVKVTGLKPGFTYCYQVMSESETGSPTLWSPGYFTTLVPPPGKKLFTFATMNDMHVGEQVAGLIVVGGIVLTPGFEWDDPDNPYWKFTNEAAVNGINQNGVDFTICKGDVSSEHRKEEFENVKGILSKLASPYYVMRGNHDKIGNDPDYYKEIFELNTTWYSFDHKNFHFIALDSVNPDGSPKISDEQFMFLENDLKSSRSQITFLFLHHAVTLEAFIWSIPREDRLRLVELLQQNPQVVGVFSGHSHRAKVTHDRTLTDLIFAETPSTKEYPMGYVLYHVYEGGYMQVFEKSYCPECLEWNSITRKEFFRLAPFFLFGRLPDRHFVVSFS